MVRKASLSRKTEETEIAVSLNIDGTGLYQINSGIGFFDHMLAQLARHSFMDIDLEASGDRHIDDHHIVEDCGIVLGQALFEALEDKKGITRYASLDLVMDECRTLAAIDISSRPFLVWNVAFTTPKIGNFDTELVREFFQAFVQNSGITLHIINHSGVNNHHIAETCFKAVARVLHMATSLTSRAQDRIPSTKGVLKR